MTIRLVQPHSDIEWQHARRLVEEYAASLRIDLSFQNFAHELEHLADEYGSPAGAFLIAEDDGALLGCAGLRQFADGVGEIKRLYVRPAARHRGVGRSLAEGIVASARQLGYVRLLLDTLPSMREAHALYGSLGFEPTAPYRDNPVASASFLALELR